MALMRTLWNFVVGVKDALVLLFMLLFFGLLWAALSFRTPAITVPNDTALVLNMDGVLVDQATPRTAAEVLSSTPTIPQVQVRDVVRAIEAAKDDGSVKLIMLDLDRFLGGGQANLQAVSAALKSFRASGKPVVSYATAYTDDSYYLAAQASEAWLNPLGGVIITGPGGTGLYFKDLLDRLKVDVEVFRVGTYKSFVEPFTRAAASPEAKAADQALADSLWGSYVADVAAARKGVDVRAAVNGWQAGVAAAGGDQAKAALNARLIDRIGDSTAVVASLRKQVGEGDTPDDPLSFNGISMADYLRARSPGGSGDAVGVLYVSGDIVDGEADAGSAGGDTIANLVTEALANDSIRALVVRIDSPGGSVTASEKIRSALMQARARDIPVVASFGPVAASGGYWIATAANRIYAAPTTITGSIGVFGIIPTFNRTLKSAGIGTDGIATTPYSGQPDILGGINEPTKALIQGSISDTYRRFVGLVAAARKLPAAEVEKIAEGRVWSGRDALDRKLVDGFGGLDAAIRDAAKAAKLGDNPRVVTLEAKPGTLEALLNRFGDSPPPPAADAFARLAMISRLRATAQIADALTMAQGASIQARCLACAAHAPPRPANAARAGALLTLLQR
ncbi:signal peptide peptidase SppA [Sandaracinobacteroides saxicola]|uniref:Signal peptide peptidase SppA n=1 Tax=Sandaracinobacteroides saxicola TaxID=2759707 RepID=A0A7G5IF05_9SPHN|nr:signal peptide peptidase SppA [Sandaracinobacteroides saxicola]QMW21947.1 signal peptide peptidase SppA [Sandaracinobacteroides saxicola]